MHSLLDLPGSEEDVLKHAQNQINESRELVKSKRDDWRDRYRLYNNQRKQRDKIGITTIYNTLNILLAIYYTDEMQATFSERTIGEDRQAENWEKLLKFDHDEMGMETINYITQWDRLFHGVGIRVVSSFDKNTKSPRVYSADPMGWLPDPSGDAVAQPFRWHGFELEMAKENMTEDLGFDPAIIENLSHPGQDDEQTALTNIERASAQNLGIGQAKAFGDKENAMFQIVNLFTRYAGEACLITLAEADKKIIRCQKIEPVLVEEKQDKSKIPFPVALNYYSPRRASPFGENVGDFTEDKQRAKSVLANIRIKVEQAKLYPMYLYNRTKILNRRDLDFGFNKLIGVDGDTNNVAAPLQKDFGTTQSEKILEADLDREVQLATGADERQAGVMSRAGATATETQQTQANANLRFILGSRINSWGEKQFVKLWMREYHRAFKGIGTKIVRVTGRFGQRLVEMGRKDFITQHNPDVEIKSKLELSREREMKRLSFAQTLPLLLQDPGIPGAAKRFSQRHMLKLSNIDYDEIDQLVPPTPDEERAFSENELLARGELVPVKMTEDHLSDIFIHQQADKTVATMNHIAAHRRAYEMQGGAAQEVDQGMIKSMAAQGQAQMGAQAAQQQAQQPEVLSN